MSFHLHKRSDFSHQPDAPQWASKKKDQCKITQTLKMGIQCHTMFLKRYHRIKNDSLEF